METLALDQVAHSPYSCKKTLIRIANPLTIFVNFTHSCIKVYVMVCNALPLVEAVLVHLCVCGGENINCQYCAGTGVATNELRRRENKDVVQSAVIAAKKAVISSASEARLLPICDKTHVQAYQERFRHTLFRLGLPQVCQINFSRDFPFEEAPPAFMAARTRALLDSIVRPAQFLFWWTPQQCEVTQNNVIRCYQCSREDKFSSIWEKPISRPQMSSANSKVSAASSAQIKELKNAKNKNRKSKKSLVTPAGSIEVRKERIDTPKNAANMKTDTPFNSVLSDKLQAALTEFRTQKALDASHGSHVFREVGSNRFGSFPSHDDYDN